MATVSGEDDEEVGWSRTFTRNHSNLSSTDKRRELLWKTERTNLLNISKLCIKNLIETSLKLEQIISDDHEPFQQFFAVIENVFRHGLKMKRNILGQRRDFWGPLESLEHICPDSAEITASVRNLPIKTNLGKGRAWIRLALMQKKLADYVREMTEHRSDILEWYDTHATLVQEEGGVIAGLLVGLNVIDCNFDVKGDNLDTWSAVLDLSLYLKDGNYLEKAVVPGLSKDNKVSSDDKVADIKMLFDQKAYLEEVNKNLNSMVADMQEKLKNMEGTNGELLQQVERLLNQVESLGLEKNHLKQENEQINSVTERKIQIAQEDISVERETYQKSREGLNDLFMASKKQLETEINLRKETERELEMQQSMKAEKEVAMRLLEKDIHDKQDTLVSLRRQLEDIKKLNLELHSKLQASEANNKQHMEKWTDLEEKCARMISQHKLLETSLTEAVAEKSEAENTASQFVSQLTDLQSERQALETNLKIEREWRTTLQEDASKDKKRIATLETELGQLDKLKKEYSALLEKHTALKKHYSEQETALVEMGSHLSSSQLKVTEMQEVTQTMKDMKWTDDKEITHCQQCNQPFSLARRKHHCRNCGGIFCNPCSDNTMPLPSSAKRVRVCDTCHTTLLQRYQR